MAEAEFLNLPEYELNKIKSFILDALHYFKEDVTKIIDGLVMEEE